MDTIRCKDTFGRDVELPADRFRYRPSVYAVFRRDNRVLVCRTRSTGKLWLPGGGVDAGETHEQALRREVREEAGIVRMEMGGLLTAFRHYGYYEPEDDAFDGHLYFYECVTAETALRPNDEIEDGEAMDFTWMEMEELMRTEFCDVDREIHGMLAAL